MVLERTIRFGALVVLMALIAAAIPSGSGRGSIERAEPERKGGGTRVAYDVGLPQDPISEAIVLPTDTVFTLEPLPVINFGSDNATGFNVTAQILWKENGTVYERDGVTYDDTVHVTEVLAPANQPGSTYNVTFAFTTFRTPEQNGTWLTLKVWITWAIDQNPQNDKREVYVEIRNVDDVAIDWDYMDLPTSAETSTGEPVPLVIPVRNRGNRDTQGEVVVRARGTNLAGAEVFTDEVTVSYIRAEYTTEVTSLKPFTAASEGVFHVNVTLVYALDSDLSNNVYHLRIEVIDVVDAAIEEVRTSIQGGSVSPGTYMINVTVLNAGTKTASPALTVEIKLNDTVRETRTETFQLAKGGRGYLQFSFPFDNGGQWSIVARVDLPGDEVPANNVRSFDFFVTMTFLISVNPQDSYATITDGAAVHELAVTNLGTGEDSIAFDTSQVPTGWSYTFDPDPVAGVPPGGTKTTNLTVIPPPGLVQGMYTHSIQAYSQHKPSERISLSITNIMGNPPRAEIKSPRGWSKYEEGDTILLDGSESYAQGASSIAKWVWTVKGSVIAEGAKATVVLPMGVHVIRLTVTDTNGLEDWDEREVSVWGLRGFNAPPVAGTIHAVKPGHVFVEGANLSATDETAGDLGTYLHIYTDIPDSAWDWCCLNWSYADLDLASAGVEEDTLLISYWVPGSGWSRLPTTVDKTRSILSVNTTVLGQVFSILGTPEEPPFSVVLTVEPVNKGQSRQYVAHIYPPGGTYTYLWDFGDGETSTEASPLHAYDLPAGKTSWTYTITLTVTDEDGRSQTATAEVEVRARPFEVAIDWTVGGENVPRINVGDTIDFVALVTQDGANHDFVRADWEFGDGTNGTGGQTSHAYEKAGEYAVTVTVTDADDVTVSWTRTIYIEDPTEKETNGNGMGSGNGVGNGSDVVPSSLLWAIVAAVVVVMLAVVIGLLFWRRSKRSTSYEDEWE